MRVAWQAVAGGAVVALIGGAGLVRGSTPQSIGAAPSAGNAAAPIVVSNAYVRAPAPPTTSAAAYFTVSNTTGTADTLQSVASGAGETTVLHTAGMTVQAGGATVPAHGKLVLSVGKGHVMIENIFGTLTAGQTVNLELSFAHNGVVDVAAPVIGPAAPVPTTGLGSSS